MSSSTKNISLSPSLPPSLPPSGKSNLERGTIPHIVFPDVEPSTSTTTMPVADLSEIAIITTVALVITVVIVVSLLPLPLPPSLPSSLQKQPGKRPLRLTNTMIKPLQTESYALKEDVKLDLLETAAR